MKKIYLFLTLMFFSLGVGNAWGAEATINFSEKGLENGVQYLDPFTIDANTTITFAGGGNDGKYYDTGTGIRTYGDGTITVECTNGTISEISFTWSGSNKPTADVATPAGYSTSTGKWTGSASSVTLTRPSGSGNWRLQEVTVTYETAGGGETPDPTPDPDPDPEPEPETGGTGTINFNSNAVKINAASVTGDDNLGNTWTITTVGTTSYTANNAYYQVGKSSEPATSITFTTTLPSEGNITAFSAKFGGFSSTAGTVTLKVDDTSVGTGSLNATSDVTISNSSQATGKKLTVTVTGIARGVKVYYISYTYTTSSGGSEPETPTPSVSVAPTSHTFATTNVGETATQVFEITAENTTETLSAEISNTTDYAISAIADNKITVTYQPQTAETHEATLTIKAGDEASATVTLSGKAVAALEGTWILVTDASSLKAGDEIIIAAKETDVALSTTQNNNNRGEVAITKNSNTITATSETQVLTLQAGNQENTLALSTGDGYLYAASSSANQLKTETELSGNSSWTIAVTADGTATLTAQGTYTRNTLCYNKSNKLFACYASTNLQQPIVIYKNTNGQQLAGLAYTTTKYLTKLGDAFTTPTLTNPNSLTVAYSSSDNNVATVDNTGTVTIKAAGVVVITAAFAGDASYLEGSAKYTLCVTEHAGTEADPYSVADARRVIDVMETAEGVYATGIVSEIVTAYNATYGNITYNISIDGSTAADQLQAYRGKGVNGENFSSANDIKVGDEVIVKGNLKKHETTYEFDADNQLVSLKRDKQQAGLAYEEKEHTANVGEDFTEPTLTNPNCLTVTYSSSNTALATVDATTGEVSILAAGKVTITASSAADATYAAGSASYNITITDPSLAIATLPFAFNGNKAAIETTAGMTQNGLGSDYSASTAPNSQLKFDGTGDWVIIRFDSEPGEFSFLLKQNGETIGTFTVYESENGEDYTPIWSGGDLGGNAKSATIEPTLSATARYVKFEYTTKPTGTNYGLGEISIKKADHRQEAGLAWNPATVSLTVGDAFTAPTLSYPNGLTGITFTSSNEALATVNNAGAISLVSGKTGTATITATYAGNETYKAAEVTCVITVSPKTENVVILAELDGKWYAMKGAVPSGTSNQLDAIEVTYFNGTLYNVAEDVKASITWTRSVVDGKATFVNNGKYLKGGTSTNLTLVATVDDACKWMWNEEDGYYTTNTSETIRTFLYRVGYNFKNYGASQAGQEDVNGNYSELPVVTAPVYKTGTLYTINATAENGTVIGAGVYEADTEVTLKADPAMDYTFVSWTKGDEVVSTANPFVFEATENLDLVANFQEIVATTYSLSGKFSTGEYEYAEFATGNLQYQPSTDTWRFAKQQYQYVGEANINVGDENYEGWIDMFGWSNGAANNYGVNPSCDKDLYVGEFVDWGTMMGEGWETLSHEQWDYLLNKRGTGKKQIARVGTVFGVLLFPDEWEMPSGISVTAVYDNYFEVYVYNYTLDQWAALENAGALFLPAAGRRFGGYGNTINYDGTTDLGEEYKLQYCTNDLAAYWTSTKHNDGKKVSYLLNLGNGGEKYSTLELGWYEYGHVGQSVRLAKVTSTLVEIGDGNNSAVITENAEKIVNVQVNRTFEANNGYYTICLPFDLAAEKIGTALQISSVTENVAEQGMNVVFTEVTNLVAGQPYLVLPSKNLTNPIFEDVTIVNTTGETTATVTGAGINITFTGIINGSGTTNGSTEYYVGDNGYLYNGTVDKLGLRAFFTITDEAGNPTKVRARVVTREDATTGFENITNGENTTIKVIENGQLIIIRNGEKFNAQGVRL